ncbi:MAG TPA: SPW repeat protein [Roseiarcus sp.]
MANNASLRGGEKNVQDWINLICGVLLFISPWALGFSGDVMAARSVWVGGVIIFLMGVAALMQFAEWEEWIALIFGALVIIAPWALRFATIHAAMWTCVVLGVIVVLSSISEIWVVHHPAAMVSR